jgi:hypothetical protein
LPPTTYVPPTKPKKIEKRRRRGQIQSGDSISDTEDVSDIEKAHEMSQIPSALRSRSGNFSPVDEPERRSDQPSGLLSQGTLKEMLLVQENSK